MHRLVYVTRYVHKHTLTAIDGIIHMCVRTHHGHSMYLMYLIGTASASLFSYAIKWTNSYRSNYYRLLFTIYIYKLARIYTIDSLCRPILSCILHLLVGGHDDDDRAGVVVIAETRTIH